MDWEFWPQFTCTNTFVVNSKYWKIDHIDAESISRIISEHCIKDTEDLNFVWSSSTNTVKQLKCETEIIMMNWRALWSFWFQGWHWRSLCTEQYLLSEEFFEIPISYWSSSVLIDQSWSLNTSEWWNMLTIDRKQNKCLLHQMYNFFNLC